MSHSIIMVSKYHLTRGSPSLIPTDTTTITSVHGDAEHVSLNHKHAPPYQGVILVLPKT